MMTKEKKGESGDDRRRSWGRWMERRKTDGDGERWAEKNNGRVRL